MHHIIADISKEGHMQLALEAYKKGLFPSKTAAAKAFDVPLRTFITCVNKTTAHKNSTANCCKLIDTEESTLSAWILDIDQHGLPPQISTVHYLAQLLLSAWLSSSQEASIGEN